MKILVTGGAGFIGSHIAEALLKAKHQVWIVDNLSTGFLENIPPSAMFQRSDIRADETGELMKRVVFDAVFHFAAQADVRKSVKDPLDDAGVNIAGSVQLLEWCRQTSVGVFIFASTGGAVYGEQNVFPAAETHPTFPVSPYGVAKLAVERYMYYYHYEFGLNTTALRYSNVYGPRQNHRGEAGVVAIFTSSLVAGESPVIWGDGRQTRDYLFIEDVVRANLQALNLKGYNIINIGTGVETDVLTLYELIRKTTGRSAVEFPPKFGPAAPGEQRRSSIDSRLAERLLNWKPEVNLDEGLQRTTMYFRERFARMLVEQTAG